MPNFMASLDSDSFRMRAELLAKGINISAICRDAIRAHHAAHFNRDPRSWLEAVIESRIEQAGKLQAEAADLLKEADRLKWQVPEIIGQAAVVNSQLDSGETQRLRMLGEINDALLTLEHDHSGDLVMMSNAAGRGGEKAKQVRLLEKWLNDARSGRGGVPRDVETLRAEVRQLQIRQGIADSDPLAGLIRSASYDSNGAQSRSAPAGEDEKPPIDEEIAGLIEKTTARKNENDESV